MFKFFTRADTLLDVAWRWGTLFTALWAGLTWLASKVKILGELNWAESVFVGLGAATVLSVALSIVLIAVRYFRPSAVPHLAGAAPERQSYDDSELRLALAELGHENTPEVNRHRYEANSGNIEALRKELAGLTQRVGVVEQMRYTLDEVRSLLKNASTEIRLENWINHRLPQLTETIDQKWATLVTLCQDYTVVPGYRGAGPASKPSWDSKVKDFEDFLEDRERWFQREIHVKVDLTATPKTSKNPLTSFAGSEKVSDDAKRIDYNRIYEMRETATKELEGLKSRMMTERAQIAGRLAMLSENVPLGAPRKVGE